MAPPRREKSLQVRFNDVEYAEMEIAASLSGMTLAAFIRYSIKRNIQTNPNLAPMRSTEANEGMEGTGITPSVLERYKNLVDPKDIP